MDCTACFSSLFDQILAAPTQVSDPPLGDTEEKEPFYIIASMFPLMFAQCPSHVLMLSPVFVSTLVVLSAVAICALFILILSTLIMVLAVTWRSVLWNVCLQSSRYEATCVLAVL